MAGRFRGDTSFAIMPKLFDSSLSLDLTDPQQLKNLLKKYRLWAKKRFGQNFLIDRSVLEDIIAAANLSETDTVLEIGPGPGVLTRELLPHVQKVMAVEIDEEILPVLRESTHFFRDRLHIHHGHVLGVDLPDVPYKVVANIPYHLTSPILRKVLVEAGDSRPESLTLLVQKEVGEKICHPKKKSILSLFVEAFGEAHIVRTVPAESFHPAPKVESAVVHIHVCKKPKISVDPQHFFIAVKMGFSQPRKKIKNNLPKEILEKAEISPDVRAETLSLEEWERITRALEEINKI